MNVCERKGKIIVEDEVSKTTGWLGDDAFWKIETEAGTTFIFFDLIVNTDNWVIYINTGS